MSKEVICALWHPVLLLLFLVVLKLLLLDLLGQLCQVLPNRHHELKRLVDLRPHLVKLRVLPAPVVLQLLVSLHRLLAEQLRIPLITLLKGN